MDKLKKIKKIDEKLSILLSKMNYDDYLYFIKNNKVLNKYDKLMGDDDYKDLPFVKKLIINNHLLSSVEKILNDKIKKLNIIK